MTDKIAIERKILEHTVIALEYAYSADDEMVQESIKYLRAALAAQPAPAAVPLTDEQIDALMSAANLSIVPEGWTVDAWVVHRVARAVERAHGIAAARDKP